jgi:membrane-associated phospholipid phosphatase
MKGRPWRYASAWLVFLGPCFFLSYGFANHYASGLAHVGSFFFAWERHMPFVAWTIVPYMSIDLFYAISLFVCTTRNEVRRHAWRLLAATLVAVICFVLFPLRFSFDRPAASGLSGSLFDLLLGFDLPFNQAPSLHIALLLLLWVIYARHTRGVLRYAMHAWFALIGLSVLTTYQHHFIDVVTGAALGAACLYFIPDPPARWDNAASPAGGPAATTRLRLARRYGAAGAALALAACALFATGHGAPAPGGAALGSALVSSNDAIPGGGLALAGALLGWTALALMLVAAAYARFGISVFQKQDGRVAWPAWWMLAPYRIAAWISSRLFTLNIAPAAQVSAHVWIGRFPSARDLRAGHYGAVVDLAAEFGANRHARRLHYAQVSMLDLVVPDTAQLLRAAGAIERAQAQGPTLVHCALGFSRSALAAAAWLIAQGATTQAALAQVRAARPAIVVTPEARAALESYARHVESARGQAEWLETIAA